ncbi:unnamed protein product [Caenorhabditis auriculariae]|uniref:Uncharacterized protein n=1 Tax=Caenorhabditis auriculariae TaxID=2777116 RepID=A0A8S1HRW1_9PELO|nr:unnamed protein product [Caenorhabditis auriculariae]
MSAPWKYRLKIRCARLLRVCRYVPYWIAAKVKWYFLTMPLPLTLFDNRPLRLKEKGFVVQEPRLVRKEEGSGSTSTLGAQANFCLITQPHPIL